ncbi:GDSL-type esterase/lipase family protein [Micromonospora sp. NPDC000018]|uniref:SGNH/GDSL hydrolase family protein n=1 Tax=Micromonospora sp. NPDC000018 TaxID=3154239 RepID=UPI003321D2B2
MPLSAGDDLHLLVRTAGGVAPAERRVVLDEHADLPLGEPDRWRCGYVLRGVMTDCRGVDDTAAPGALRPGSLRLRDARGPLRVGREVLVDEHWAAVTRTGPVTGPVIADYEFSLLRVDALVLDGQTPRIVRGHSHLSNPLPPPIPAGSRHLAAIFVPYFATASEAVVVRIDRGPGHPISPPQRELLPATSAALAAGRPLRITCWGDSVTAGASASSLQTTYPAQLRQMLAAGGIAADVATVAVGGTTSAEWFDDDAGVESGADWGQVAATRPDLVILEFINDADLEPGAWAGLYDGILRRIRELGADLLLLEPHFSRMDWMRIDRIDAADPRPYVAFLRRFARREGVAIAAVSRRWERLYSEGVPYPTLLRNGINHPDDRGHRIFAEEAAAVIGVPRTT